MKVAYIGGISEERGIYELLAALNLLPASLDIKLELAGRFYSAEVEQRVSRDVGWKRVNWRGLLDRGEVRDLLGRVRAGMLVLHPEENFLVSQPVKLFEYMAAGIPVIASDFPLWRSIVMDAGCGLMVNPNDPGAIARAIKYLLTHDDEAAAMGQRGRLAVEERYNWTREERTFLKFYRSLLDPAADALPAVKQTC
jgi:glycosyltransferase involved in cell wall biosynthesis